MSLLLAILTLAVACTATKPTDLDHPGWVDLTPRGAPAPIRVQFVADSLEETPRGVQTKGTFRIDAGQGSNGYFVAGSGVVPRPVSPADWIETGGDAPYTSSSPDDSPGSTTWTGVGGVELVPVHAGLSTRQYSAYLGSYVVEACVANDVTMTAPPSWELIADAQALFPAHGFSASDFADRVGRYDAVLVMPGLRCHGFRIDECCAPGSTRASPPP